MAAHLSAPFVMAWDDHEVDNDYAGNFDERDTPPEVFLLRRAAAYQAYYESMPLRASLLPNGPNLLLYRHLQFGNLIDMSILDTRQYRSKQAACGNPKTCPELLDVKRTILGETQERWLFGTLAQSRATWTVIGQQVPTFARDMVSVSEEARYSVDKWDGYAESRNRLFAHIRDAKVPNPVVLSGDVHTHWCADLKVDFTKPETATIGVEFTNSSVTSGGDGSDVQPTWEGIRRDNPHITYHSNKRGYIACTATATSMKADFRVVDRVTAAGQPARTARAMIVEAGRPGSQTA
jgi:alkaline phosphatase D